jgi:transposase
MIQLVVKQIYLARDLVDMRKSFNTLADIVKFNLNRDPYSGDAFVFVGKRKNRLKVLVWEDTGFWLCSKRLEKGTFSISQYVNSKDSAKILSQSEWHNLLEGIVILSSKKLKRFPGMKKIFN